MTAIAYPPARIQVFRPSIGEEEIDAVAGVMRSGWIGNGPKVAEFEREWAAHIGVDPAHVVSVNSATEGLYQIMQELYQCHSVTSVVMPDNAFIGTSNAASDIGLRTQVCDIDRQTLTTDAEYMAEHMRPKATIVYQNYGGISHPAHAYYLLQLADLWDTPVVEDLSCNPMQRPIGDHAVWSFDAMKILTCGDGGMVYCQDANCAHYIRQSTRLGMSTESGQSASRDKWWEFRAATPGRRSIMNDIGAAIGLVQLRRLGEMVKRRQEIWNYYQSGLMKLDWLTLPDGGRIHWGGLSSNSYYTYWISLPVDGMRDRLAHYLREHGVYVTYRYQSISRAYNWDLNMPNSHWANDHVLNLPLHPGLTDDDVSYVCEMIAEFGRTL